MDLKDKLIADFQTHENFLNEEKEPSFASFRKEALHNFEVQGFPTPKHEEWKYTAVAEIINHDYQIGNQENSIIRDLERYFIPGLKANNLIFVNGKFKKELSSFLDPANSLVIKDLSEVDFEEYSSSCGKYKSYNEDGFTYLNQAYSTKGIMIEVLQNKVLQAPVTFYFFSDSRTGNVFSLPHIIVNVEENSQSKFIEHYIKIGEKRAFTNSIVEINIKENAILKYYKLQNEGDNASQVSTTQVNQVGKSIFNSVAVSLSGDLIRNNLNCTINAPFSESHLYGLTLLNATSHVDNHTVVDHAVPNCESNELYKNVLDENSSAVFNGKIFVRQDAQKTNAYQSSKNILLSDTATAYSKPQLEIWADDVKCSHGHATGQFDKEALFYLRARGIGKQNATAMLTKAFADDIINKISIEPLKEFLEKLIEERFKVQA